MERAVHFPDLARCWRLGIARRGLTIEQSRARAVDLGEDGRRRAFMLQAVESRQRPDRRIQVQARRRLFRFHSTLYSNEYNESANTSRSESKSAGLAIASRCPGRVAEQFLDGAVNAAPVGGTREIAAFHRQPEGLLGIKRRIEAEPADKICCASPDRAFRMRAECSLPRHRAARCYLDRIVNPCLVKNGLAASLRMKSKNFTASGFFDDARMAAG